MTLCEIEMNESCAGASFSLKRGDKLTVGRDIDHNEAVAWVEGRRARVVAGDLPGVSGTAPAAPVMIGSAPVERAVELPQETIIRHRRKG
jgi:hypothetical protein